jgi:hypothetical protein
MTRSIVRRPRGVWKLSSQVCTVALVGLWMLPSGAAAQGAPLIINTPITTSNDVVLTGNPIIINASIRSINGEVRLNGPVQLGADVFVEGGRDRVTFNGTLDGPGALTVSSAIETVFNGVVGGVSPLRSITTTTPVAFAGTGSVSTLGGQTYGGRAQLLGALTITSLSGPITFSQAVASTVANPLTINANNGAVIFAFVHAVNVPIAVNGAGDARLVLATAGTTPQIVTATGSNVGAAAGDTYFATGGGLAYSGVSQLSVDTGGGADTFHITPSATTAMVLNGNAPFTSTGDTLDVNLSLVTVDALTLNGADGQWSFSDRRSIDFLSMERVLTPAPRAAPDSFTNNVNVALAVPVPGNSDLLDNDSDPLDLPLTAELVPGTGPNHGTLTFDSDGSFVYTPEQNFVGIDGFDYIARNSAGTASEAAAVTITMVPEGGPGGGNGGGGGGCTLACPPGARETPELDSLLLLASGMSGLGGYAALRLRARRRR